MKKLIVAAIFSAVVSGANAGVNSNVKFVGDTEYAGFCKAVMNDNVVLFKRSLKRFVGPLGGTRQDVLERVLQNDNVQCAGQGIADFAQQRDAEQVSQYIKKFSA